MDQTLLQKTFSPSELSDDTVQQFQHIIYDYYEKLGRRFPWRDTNNPYHILVSEIMLQQTQTDRVVSKYNEFIETFPDFSSLAEASFQQVLSVWQGLGYNRRALALKKTAETVVKQFHGVLPDTVDDLQRLPGLGEYTAAAICAFAFNQPTVFIETNIRTVFLHFFFQDQKKVKDSDVYPVVEQTMDTSNPREWYYALMDYGVMLKKRYPHVNKKSAHYVKQNPFQGSNRQIRGRILKELITNGSKSFDEILKTLLVNPEKLQQILLQLEKEGLIVKEGSVYTIAQR